jgi:hypothetical protein
MIIKKNVILSFTALELKGFAQLGELDYRERKPFLEKVLLEVLRANLAKLPINLQNQIQAETEKK